MLVLLDSLQLRDLFPVVRFLQVVLAGGHSGGMMYGFTLGHAVLSTKCLKNLKRQCFTDDFS
jgi:hypothetical protein